MIALVLALSLAAHSTHAHAHRHGHRHGHKPAHVLTHKPAPAHVNRCAIDAERVQALEQRIGSAADPEAELERLEGQLERAIERAQQDCGS